MKPRLMILSAFLSPMRSGAEACAEEIALRLSDQYNITIITAKLRRDLPRNSKLQTSNSVSILRVGLGCSIDKYFYPFIAPFIARKLKPDIIHAVLESYAGLALVLSRFTCPGARKILTCQSTNTSLFLRLMHRSADIVTVISSVLQKRAVTLGRSDAVLIPNGIDLREIERAVNRHRKVPGRVLFVGRLEHVKGVDVLLSALGDQCTSTLIHLHVVGDGSRRRNLECLAVELHIEDRVHFLGRLTGDALYKEYAEAEIFCGLSRSEALGNVFLEAQAAGCAVVAANVGGIPDIVQDGETGALVPPENPAAAAGALEKFLMDPAFRRKIVDGGKVHAKGYNWDRIALRYDAIYRNLLLRTSSAAL